MDSLEQLVEAISKESGKSSDEVRKLIEEKKDELSGLVSEEGAAYIVGRELGVALLKEGKRNLKVKNLVGGMNSVDLVARIVNVSGVREFEREGKKGRVQSLVLGDETGVVRLPLWNEEIDRVAELELKEDDVISLSGGWAKVDNRGAPELRLGRGRIAKSKEEVTIPGKQEIRQVSELRRTDLKDAKEGDFVEVRACLVQLFQKEPFFQTCPSCGTRVFEEDGKTRCKEHGIVSPQDNMVISGVVDDGTGNIRAVFFREMAEQLLGQKTKTLLEAARKKGNMLSLYDDFHGMGRDFIIGGRVKKNDFSGNLELVVNGIREMDVRQEIEKLLGKTGREADLAGL